MNHTLSNGTRTANLPADMLWSDEYDYIPVQSRSTPTLDGGLVVEQSLQIKGRPLTLEGGDDRGWMLKSELDKLFTLASQLTPLTFTHADGRIFTVAFVGGDSLKARGLYPLSLPSDDAYFVATLKLMII
jgi:hypothetical protein